MAIHEYNKNRTAVEKENFIPGTTGLSIEEPSSKEGFAGRFNIKRAPKKRQHIQEVSKKEILGMKRKKFQKRGTGIKDKKLSLNQVEAKVKGEIENEIEKMIRFLLSKKETTQTLAQIVKRRPIPKVSNKEILEARARRKKPQNQGTGGVSVELNSDKAVVKEMKGGKLHIMTDQGDTVLGAGGKLTSTMMSVIKRLDSADDHNRLNVKIRIMLRRYYLKEKAIKALHEQVGSREKKLERLRRILKRVRTAG